MLRGFIIAFVAGWLLWFWVDKSSFEFARLPPARAGEYVANFQTAVDLVRSGHYAAAYVFIWNAHFLVLSAGLGLVISMLTGAAARAINRRKLIKLYVPDKKRPDAE